MKEPLPYKILVAEGCRKTVHSIMQAQEASRYHMATAFDAETLFERLKTFQPHLILLDLMLPHMYGIEIIQQILLDPETAKIGIIILSAEPMIQNYRAALEAGAVYFLAKPFEPSHLFSLIERFFLHTLTPPSFSEVAHPLSTTPIAESYLPHIHPAVNYIKFWGTRGSHPVSGRHFAYFGGNTSCLQIHYGDTDVIIDAGTGISSLGFEMTLHPTPRIIHIFLSHTHLDHIGGFPFFQPLYHSSFEIHLYLPTGFEKSIQQLFQHILTYTYFPVRFEDMEAKIIFHEMRDGNSFQIGDIKLSIHYAFHPGPTLCFFIQTPSTSFGYVTDNEILMGYTGHPNHIHREHSLFLPHLPLIDAMQHADFLIHEAQYTPFEYRDKVGWGHSSMANATVFIKHSSTKEWIVTHHNPSHNDEDLFLKLQLHYDILKISGTDCHTRMAFDGWVLPI